MRIVHILLLLLLIPVVHAEIGILDADKATLELVITSSARFTAQNSDAYVAEASADLSWYPRETYNQDVDHITTEPDARIGDVITYSWEEPTLTSHSISLESVIITNNGITPVRNKPPFPLERFPVAVIPYTQPSAMIDHNADIARLASELASGKDDQYEVVFALADWVTTNIEYDLNTLTANANYPSSWVLEQRYGVCDEMTNLFISLNRALGIPARFVSGLAYTNLESLPTNWGGHGWAEVYFPDTGWIPFDVTYGEYGYVDSGHIKLKDSIDSQENSIEFRATGYGFNIQSQPLDFAVDILGTSPRNYEFIEAELTAYDDEVRFGSHNLLTLRLKNLRDYYVSTRVELGETTQMSHVSSDEANVLLKPYEEREFHFLVKVDDNLDRQYKYTFPIAAFTKLGDPAESTFTATSDGRMYEEDAFTSYFTDDKKSSANIDITCTAPTPVRETADIQCTFTNNNSAIIGTACINTECVTRTLKDTFTISHSFTRDEPGIYTLPVTFSNKDVQASQFVTVHILDEITMNIRDVELPETIRFDDQGKITFTLVRTSASAPTNATVRVEHDHFMQEWNIDEITTIGEYELRFTGDRLSAGENFLRIIVEYDDAFGEHHKISQVRKITLVDLTFSQRFYLWLDAIDRWLQKTLS